MKSFLESIFGADRALPGWLRTMLWLALALLVLGYAGAALEHGKKCNLVPESNDQMVYMKYASGMVETNYDMFVSRMRMPMYMWLLSLAATPNQTYTDFFPVAQAFSVVLSLVCLGVMFMALKRWLGNAMGICFTLAAAGQLFILRASYVQPELVLTTIITITVAWLAYAMRNPNWQNGALCGLLLCAWFLTKASAQITLFLFCFFLGAKWLTAKRGGKMPFIICALATVTLFLVPILPYLWNSYKIFGEPFYNVQGKYFMWASVAEGKAIAKKEDEKHWLQSLGLDRGFDNVTPEIRARLPGAGKYWREHSMNEIEQRILRGMDLLWKAAYPQYTSLWLMLLIWAGIALSAMAVNWPVALAALLRWRWELLFVSVLLAAFVVLFAWFVPLRAGTRLITSVSLVPIFFAAAATHLCLRSRVISCCGMTLSLERILAFFYVLGWGALTLMDVPPSLSAGYFGG